MTSLKTWALAALAAVCLAPAVGTAADREKGGKPSLAGVYLCVGDNGDGTTYKGVVDIAESGDTYVVEWTIKGSTHLGVGIWENDRLSVSWATLTPDRKVLMGVVVYEKSKDGTLTGKWTAYPGGGKLAGETLSPVKK